MVRVMAKGFSQKHGVDYEETFPPAAKFTSKTILINLAAKYKITIHKIYVKTSFQRGL